MGLLELLLGLLGKGAGRGNRKRKKRKKGARKGPSKVSAAEKQVNPPTKTRTTSLRGAGGGDPVATAPPKPAHTGSLAGFAPPEGTAKGWGKGSSPARSKTNELTQTMRMRIESFFRRPDEPKDLKRRKPLHDELKPILDRADSAAVILLLEDRTADADNLIRTETVRLEALSSLETTLHHAARDHDPHALKQQAVRLVGEAALLGDDILKEAREVRAILPKLQEAIEAHELDTVETWCRDFDVRQLRLDKEMHRQARFLTKVGGKLLKALSAKDFGLVVDLTEQVISAGSVVAARGEEVEIPEVTDRTEVSAQGNQDKWKQIDKQLLQLVQTLKAKHYPFVVPLAILVQGGSAVMGDPIFGRAVELLKGSMALRKLMQGEVDPNLLRAANVLSRTAEVFDGQVVNRSNQMVELAEACIRDIRAGNHASLRKTSMELLRTTELLSDPTVTKASRLRTDIAKVESALKRRDIGEASLLLDAALET
ncbi:MAG: hypothetical protein VKO21_00320 [Candidatus Sericytochromatia bacterium]|nr:hypothetical protein [Candidatus Sericytochromatia bacterium]